MMGSRRKYIPSLDPTVDEDYDNIVSLLHAKVQGHPLPNGAVIQECDLYGDKNPWEIWDAFGGGRDGSRELYLFSTVKMNNSTRELVRTVGLGTWEPQYTVSIVSNDTDQPVGIKQCLRFENSGTNQDNGSWVMHEYRLDDHDLISPTSSSLRSPSVSYSYVLCKLIKNRGRLIVRRRINNKEFLEITILLPLPAANINKSTEGEDDALREGGVDKRVTAEEKEITADEEGGDRPIINSENGNKVHKMVDEDNNEKNTVEDTPDDDDGQNEHSSNQ